MSLRHVLLVYLESGAASGYDIVKGFRGSFGYLWNASYQQVYRDLGRLHEDGLISAEERPSAGGRPPRKLYRLTDSGRAALHHWLNTPVKLPRYNDAFMVKVASAHLMPDKQPLLDELRSVRQRYQRYLEGLQRYQALFDAMSGELDTRLRFARLSLERGIEVNRSWLAWSERLETALHDELHETGTVSARH